MKGEDIDPRVVVDATPALIFSARPDGYVDYFNRRWFLLLGARQDELEGWGWTKFIHPDDLEEHVQRWRAAMIGGQPPVSQARVRNAKGEHRWMLHRTEPLRDAAGNVLRWFGSSIDIEDLKRAEHELQGLKEQLYKENVALRDEIHQTSMFEEIVGTSQISILTPSGLHFGCGPGDLFSQDRMAGPVIASAEQLLVKLTGLCGS